VVRIVSNEASQGGGSGVMERKSFFAAVIEQNDLELKATSSRVDDRWLAAVALSRVFEDWAFDLLHQLKTDTDESTRSAARAALRQFPRDFFDRFAGAGSAPKDTDFVPGIWKLRPLPEYEHAIRDLFLAAVVDLISVEGPVTGSRVQTMLTKASLIGRGGKVSKGRTRTLLVELLDSNLLTRADSHLSNEDIDLWILHQPGTPELLVRKRMGRELIEIPVNEARAVLQLSSKFRRNPKNRDSAFRILMDHYEIKQNEFFLVGEAMANQWQTLFDAA
jgi:hypothetical protein